MEYCGKMLYIVVRSRCPEFIQNTGGLGVWMIMRFFLKPALLPQGCSLKSFISNKYWNFKNTNVHAPIHNRWRHGTKIFIDCFTPLICSCWQRNVVNTGPTGKLSMSFYFLTRHFQSVFSSLAIQSRSFFSKLKLSILFNMSMDIFKLFEKYFCQKNPYTNSLKVRICFSNY